MNIKIPQNISLLCDVRLIYELNEYFKSLPLLNNSFSGNNDPVLVLPGFMTGDFCTSPMRTFLNSIGYCAEPWELGINTGPTNKLINSVASRVMELYEKYNKPINLVGWSLGGIYAREIAKRLPDQIDKVITLGTPFNGLNVELVKKYFLDSGINDLDALTPKMVNQLHIQSGHPYTSIYSKSDQLINWRACYIKNNLAQKIESVEIDSSHFGMCHNPSAINVVADRLSYTTENWKFYKK